MNLENLVTKLAQEGAKKSIIGPWKIFALCSLFTFLYLAILLYFFGLRQDFYSAIVTIDFQIEIILNLLVILASTASLSFLRLPDFSNKNIVKFLPLLFFAALLATICCKIYCSNEAREVLCDNAGYHCLIGIIIFSVIPVIFLLIILRQGVMINFIFCFLNIGIASSALAYLGERLMHETEDAMHLLLWHFLPSFIVILLSAIVTKIFIKKL